MSLSANTPVVAAEPELQAAAAAVAKRFSLPLSAEQTEFALELTREGLQLRWLTQPKISPLTLDYTSGKQAWRRQAGGIKDEAIARAFGLARNYRPRVLDATAGLGRDAMVLAHAGCHTQLLERHPVVHALLSLAIEHASQDQHIGSWVSSHVQVLARGSIADPDTLQQLSKEPPQGIYLDPMFPHRDKSAQVKKDMQMLQQLVGADDDADALLPAALALATHRVVVKRPARAPLLSGQTPSSQITTKKHRFDVYIKQAY